MKPSSEAVDYAWRELLRRAGWVGEDVPRLHYGAPNEAPSGTRVTIIPAGELSPDPALGTWDALPMLFTNEALPRVTGEDVIPADLILGTLFLLCRFEETHGAFQADEHDRYPASESYLHRHGLLERPLVDEWALALGALLERKPTIKKLAVEVSHDVDDIRAFANPLHGLRRAAGDLVKRGSPAEAWQTVRGTFDPNRDLYMQAIRTLADHDEAVGLRGTFYFQTCDASPRDTGYGADEVLRIVEELRERGHRIGWHPGYEAARDPERLAVEADRFARLSGLAPDEARVRHHYLRVRHPDSWRWLAELGFRHEASMGFADAPGFRAGTCHAYRPFDLAANRELPITLEPLIVMEATLQRYLGLEPTAGVETALRLAERCREVGGTFSLLWHNTGLVRHWAHWSEAFPAILNEVSGS